MDPLLKTYPIEFRFSGETGSRLAHVDQIRFERLLSMADVEFVRASLGRRAAAGRWFRQITLFYRQHCELAVVAGHLARARAQENSCPLDRQLHDVATFALLWGTVGTMATAHFVGVPLKGALNRRYRRLTEVVASIRPQALDLPIPGAA